MSSAPDNTTPSSTSGGGRDAATKIVRVLRDAGHVAYFAGGCVRDELLGLHPDDYDVATDARPEKVRELFHKSRFVGEAFGVTLVRLMGHEVEVATFRNEWGYEDGRRPTKIEFTDAEHDARRRDFTINGLFEDPLAASREAAVIDFVGGREDLKGGVIRAIGDADERFGEDYLRMLRAARFAARLSFRIEDRTARAICFHAAQLGQISRERIGQEVLAMLVNANRAAAASLMQELHLDAPALLEDRNDAQPATLARLPREASITAALAAWMLDRRFFPSHLPTAALPGPAAPHDQLSAELERFAGAEAAALIGRWRKALCLSNDQTDMLRAIFSLLPAVVSWTGKRVAARKRLLASPAWRDSFDLIRAIAQNGGAAWAAPVRQMESEVAALLSTDVAPPPLVTGDDLVALGRRPGPAFRRLLDAAYDEQLEGRLATRDEALAWLKKQE